MDDCADLIFGYFFATLMNLKFDCLESEGFIVYFEDINIYIVDKKF